MDAQATRQTVLEWLDHHEIPYKLYLHEQAHTIEQCLQMPFITNEVTICKNILLCNRQQTRFFLLLLKPLTPFRTSVVSKALGVSRLSFAPENALVNMLHLASGSLSPLGLMFDTAREITLCYEADVANSPQIAFHPCDNCATLVFKQEVFWERLIPALRIEPIALNCVVNEND